MNIHFIELRERLIKIIIFVLTIFIGLFIIRDKFYALVAIPILTKLPQGSSLIATDITSTFLVPTKLSFIGAIYFSIPFILFQIWQFISPGLYPSEKKSILPLAILSSLLFYIGNLFAFYIICPLAIAFFTACAPQNVQVMTDIGLYLDFLLTVMFATGCAFQVPIITKLLIYSGITSKQSLKNKRSYVIVAAFILGMFLTPPDVVSQVLLALPIWLLFELGLLLSFEKNIK